METRNACTDSLALNNEKQFIVSNGNRRMIKRKNSRRI